MARFTQEVKQLNGSNLYDINIHAENVLIPLLREAFDFSGLQNANVKTKNAPAIDLIDYENGVLVQVTATSDADKISKTLTKFTENEQYRPFQRILIYIITERQTSYRKDFAPLLPPGYDFDPERDIIDNIGFGEYIKSHILGIRKLAKISQLLSDEFSDLEIQKRQLTTTREERSETKKDQVFPNLLKMEIPSALYIADVQFDFEHNRTELKASLKEKGQSYKIKRLTKKDDVKHFFRESKVEYFNDYILFENKLLTFRDLHRSKEPLRKVIDQGTITELSPNEFIGENTDKERVFKSLLTATLSHDFLQRGIEWIHAEKRFRFRMLSRPPKPLKVPWISSAGRGVIFGVKSKGNETTEIEEDGTKRSRRGKHYTCYRHLAFETTFSQFGEHWYMALKPEWSFTNPKDGHRQSQYADKYMSGIKKMEHNDSVFQYFKFLSGYLISISNGDIVTKGFTIRFSEFSEHFYTKPAVLDEVWSQTEPKGKESDKDQLILDWTNDDKKPS